jgi:hypothetical protein
LQDTDCPSPRDGDLRVAVAALWRCRRSVRSLPLLAPRLSRSLGGLAAWYERVGEDDRYANAAPAEGLRALERMSMHHETSALSAVVVGHRAVAVANELVAYQRQVDAGDSGDPIALQVAMSGLAVAMRSTKVSSGVGAALGVEPDER